MPARANKSHIGTREVAARANMGFIGTSSGLVPIMAFIYTGGAFDTPTQRDISYLIFLDDILLISY